MHFDIFSQGTSVLHSLDPRTKILSFIPLVFVVALLETVWLSAFYLGIALLLVFIARIDLRALLNRIAALNFFIVLLWLTLPFSVEGHVIFSFKGLAFTVEGALYTLVITLKANAILLFSISIIGSTDVFSLAHALFHLKFPRKLVYLMVFIYRYITVLHQEYNRLINTAKARCFSPKTNINTLKTYAYMVGMLFVSSYERSQRIYQALTLRGFRNDFPMLRHFHFHKKDLVFSVVMVFIILGRFLLWI